MLGRVVEVKVPKEIIKILGLRDTESLEKHSRLVLPVELYMGGRGRLNRLESPAAIFETL